MTAGARGAALPHGATALLATALVLAGCLGHEFVRPPPESLILGRTTHGDIVARLGPPSREGTVSTSEPSLKTATYAYSAGREASDGVVPARAMTFFFRDDLLVGQQFVSSFRDDHTDFDETKVRSMKVGETTRSQVIQLLGPPSGTFIYPLAKGYGSNGLGYAYAETNVRRAPLNPRADTYMKRLRVSLDPNDMVNDVTFIASGQR